MWYALFYLVGLLSAYFSPQGEIERILTLIEPITITALVASLLVPFAGFAKTERWQKWAVQYGMVPIFGVYTVHVWQTASILGFVMLATATIVHAGYWLSSLHSRTYRLKMFELGFAREMPITARLIARLNGAGNAHVADTLIQAILQGKDFAEKVALEMIDHGGLGEENRALVTDALTEAKSYIRVK